MDKAAWRKLNPIEKAKLVEKHVKRLASIRKAARALDISRRHARRLLLLLKLPEDVQEKLARGEMGVNKALEAYRKKSSDPAVTFGQSGRSTRHGQSELEKLREELTAREEENRRLHEANLRLMEENRRLREALGERQSTLVVLNRLRKIFGPLEKREEEVMQLLRGVVICGVHRYEVWRWLGLLRKLERALEEVLSTVQGEIIEIEGSEVQ